MTTTHIDGNDTNTQVNRSQCNKTIPTDKRDRRDTVREAERTETARHAMIL